MDVQPVAREELQHGAATSHDQPAIPIARKLAQRLSRTTGMPGAVQPFQQGASGRKSEHAAGLRHFEIRNLAIHSGPVAHRKQSRTVEAPNTPWRP